MQLTYKYKGLSEWIAWLMSEMTSVTKALRDCYDVTSLMPKLAVLLSCRLDAMNILYHCRKHTDGNKNGTKKAYAMKHLWIRVALVEKLLAQIVDYLVNNAE